MLAGIIATAYRFRNLGISGIAILFRISNLMAVMVINHIGCNILLIVRDINRSRMLVASGEMPPIIRRFPRLVINHYQAVEDIRCRHISRLYDIFRSVDKWVTYNLHVSARNERHFCHQRGYILIYIRCQNGLNQEYVRISLHGFQDTQIINISVAVQIKVTQHIRRVIKQVFKVLHGERLCKSGSYCLQIQIQGYILTDCCNSGFCNGLHFFGSHRRCIYGRIDGSRLGLHHYGGLANDGRFCNDGSNGFGWNSDNVNQSTSA